MRPSTTRQRGAATLVVVMILFFIMAMMAAFANRNLIFEQRIASNYYRSGVAVEAADAGSEWALGMLNGANINAACTTTGNPSTSFRQRYIGISPASRVLTPLQAAVSASCVRVAGAQGWTCQCPAGSWAPAAIADAGQMQPSFEINFQPAGRAGIVRIISTGCTGSQSNICSGDQATANSQLLGAAVVRVEAALVSALKMPPAVPLTVKQTVTDGTGALGLHNTDTRSSGLLLLTGGAAPLLDDTRLDSLPGTPGQQALISGDASLNLATTERMFAMFFGMAPGKYQNQPAMRTVSCDGDCSGPLKAAYNLGMRMIWVDGPLTLSSNERYGAEDDPMLLVANGPVTINGPMIFNGLLYARGNIAWDNPSAQLALVNGAVIGEGTLQVSGKVDLWYQAAIIDKLSNAMGSFVRVPGSWWDSN
jgi:Tfp pilus assembly protein PilX